MGKKSARYTTVKIAGKPFVYTISRVKYRDKSGRFAKFNPRRKLKVEVYAKREVVDKRTMKKVLKERKVQKHSLGYAKRKKPTTVESVNARIAKKLKKKQGVTTFFDNGYMSIQYWFKKTQKKPTTQRVRKVKLKGISFDEYLKTFGDTLPNNPAV